MALESPNFRTPVNERSELTFTDPWQAWISSLYQHVRRRKTVATLNFPNMAAQTSSDLTVTVKGAAIGDGVMLGPPVASVVANSCYTAWVSAADEVTVRFNNYSAGALNPASGDFVVMVTKQ